MDCRPREKGRGGRGNRGDESRNTRLSRSLSYVLRHGASKMGLQMNSDGFVFVEDLLTHQQFRSYSLEDVQRVVATNDKQRFKLQTHPDNGRLQIRANQGHSVEVTDLELKELAPGDPDCPKEAVHGTYMKHWPSIRGQGLSRMNRTHIHLAPGLPGEGRVISGMRQNCEMAVYINVPKAMSDGIQFFWSENGVLLTPGDAGGMLAPCYFSRAQQLKPIVEGLDLSALSGHFDEGSVWHLETWTPLLEPHSQLMVQCITVFCECPLEGLVCYSIQTDHMENSRKGLNRQL